MLPLTYHIMHFTVPLVFFFPYCSTEIKHDPLKINFILQVHTKVSLSLVLLDNVQLNSGKILMETQSTVIYFN